jgi:hypothetical protein
LFLWQNGEFRPVSWQMVIRAFYAFLIPDVKNIKNLTKNAVRLENSVYICDAFRRRFETAQSVR